MILSRRYQSRRGYANYDRDWCVCECDWLNEQDAAPGSTQRIYGGIRIHTESTVDSIELLTGIGGSAEAKVREQAMMRIVQLFDRASAGPAIIRGEADLTSNYAKAEKQTSIVHSHRSI